MTEADHGNSEPTGHPIAGYPEGFYEFVDLFNRGEYYDCHETLETVWLDTQGEERDFYQGLIHIATAFHHVSRANMKGARLLMMSGHDLLKPYPEVFHHFPVGEWRRMCEAWFPSIDRAWRRKSPIGLDALPIPPIRLVDAS